MKASHRKTLEAIFSQPVSGTLECRRIEALFAEEAKAYQVRDAPRFLENAGVKP